MTEREKALEALLRDARELPIMGYGIPGVYSDLTERIDAALRAPESEWPEPSREALIRLLWRSVADGDTACNGGNDDLGACEPAALLDVCQAMRALGWGEHWDSEVFQQRAVVADRGSPLPEKPSPASAHSQACDAEYEPLLGNAQDLPMPPRICICDESPASAPEEEMTPEERAGRLSDDYCQAPDRHPPLLHEICPGCLAGAIRAAENDALERAARICEEEAAEYDADRKRCDAGGNTFGGSMDNASVLACNRVAARIRALASPEKPPEEK